MNKSDLLDRHAETHQTITDHAVQVFSEGLFLCGFNRRFHGSFFLFIVLLFLARLGNTQVAEDQLCAADSASHFTDQSSKRSQSVNLGHLCVGRSRENQTQIGGSLATIAGDHEHVVLFGTNPTAAYFFSTPRKRLSEVDQFLTGKRYRLDRFAQI